MRLIARTTILAGLAFLYACMEGSNARELVANPGTKTNSPQQAHAICASPGGTYSHPATATHDISCISFGIIPRCSVWPTAAGRSGDRAYRNCMARNGYTLR